MCERRSREQIRVSINRRAYDPNIWRRIDFHVRRAVRKPPCPHLEPASAGKRHRALRPLQVAEIWLYFERAAADADGPDAEDALDAERRRARAPSVTKRMAKAPVAVCAEVPVDISF